MSTLCKNYENKLQIVVYFIFYYYICTLITKIRIAKWRSTTLLKKKKKWQLTEVL
jgi:hypothetical protein